MSDNTKKLLFAAAFTAGAAALSSLYLTAPGRPGREQKNMFYGRNIAHRGLHSKDKLIPENSLRAFRAAAEAGYGIELDVRFSKDKKVVVFHDDTLERVCGVDARVDSLSYEELSALRLCGSEEKIPLFTQVLETVDARVPIIIELKNGKNDRGLCRSTYEILRSYRGEVCVESFNPFIIAWFRFHAPEMLRGVLACPKENYKGMPRLAGFILSRTALNFLARPQFIAYQTGRKPLSVHLAYALGAMRVCWTAHSAEHEKKNDTVIFEYYMPQTRYK